MAGMIRTRLVDADGGEHDAMVTTAEPDPADAARLAPFRDLHAGERCVVIGNGPSLNRTDLSRLAGHVTFGFNSIFLMTQTNGFRPSYYVVEDNFVVEDNIDEINRYHCDACFFPERYKDVVKADPTRHFLRTDWAYYWNSHPFGGKPRFSTDASRFVHVGQTVTYIALQLAWFMGFREVVLVGMDFDYRVSDASDVQGTAITTHDADPNHFHPAYFGYGRRWHDPRLDRVAVSYAHARKVWEGAGRRIVNATLGGRLEIFERVALDDAFPPSVAHPVARPVAPAAHALLSAAARARRGGGALAVDPALAEADTDLSAILESCGAPYAAPSAPPAGPLELVMGPAARLADPAAAGALARASEALALSVDPEDPALASATAAFAAAGLTRQTRLMEGVLARRRDAVPDPPGEASALNGSSPCANGAGNWDAAQSSEKKPIRESFPFTDLEKLVTRRRPVVLEIGAHHGWHTQTFLRFLPDARIFAFEPDPRNITRFRRNVLSPQVTLFTVAVGAADGTVTFHQSGGEGIGGLKGKSPQGWDMSGSIRPPKRHTELFPDIRFDTTIEVRQRSLDSWAKEVALDQVDFLWADMQGAEQDMIAGGGAVLKRTRYMHLEYSDDELYEGQKTLAELVAMLPDFEVMETFIKPGFGDVLLRNKRYKSAD